MNSMDYVKNIGLSGWLSAILFGTIFSVVFYKLNEKNEIKSAKIALKYEMIHNLKYISYIYWCKFKAENQIARDIYYPCISMLGTYGVMIFKKYPNDADKIIWLFSVFNQISKTGEVVSSLEDEYDIFTTAVEINKSLNLGLKDNDIMNILKRNYSIR